MKNYSLVIISICFIALCSCKSKENNAASSQSEQIKKDSTDVKKAAEYTCPMHPEVVSDKPGKCPQCGMDLMIKS